MAGASAAAFLAAHVRVAVVEREALAGMHTTGRSAAMFMESYGPAQVRALTRASRHYLEQGAGWLSPRSALFIARASQAQALAELEAQLHADGVGTGSLQHLTTAQALHRVPALRPQAAAGALLDTSAADLDVNALHQHFLGCVRALGSTIHLGVGLSAVRRDGAHWHLQADDGRCWQAPVVVNAAGAWVDTVATLAGVSPIGIQPRRRSAFTFAPPPGTGRACLAGGGGRRRGLLFQARRRRAAGFARQRRPGAAARRGRGGTGHRHRHRPHRGSHHDDDPAPAAHLGGLRSFVASGQLVGAFDATAPGFFWCCGQGGYGIQTAPAMGQACAARVLGRSLPSALADQGLTFAQLDHQA